MKAQMLFLCAVAIAGISDARLPKHIPRFAFDRDEAPYSIPLVINIILVNLGPSAQPSAFQVDKDSFEQLLFQLLPEHQPSCVESRDRLHVTFELYYEAIHVSQPSATDIARTLQQRMERTSLQQSKASLRAGHVARYRTEDDPGAEADFVPVYEIPVEGEVADALDALYLRHTDADDHQRRFAQEVDRFGLIVLNMDKSELAPDGLEGGGDDDAAYRYAYRYRVGGGSGSDSFVSRDRYAVVDLSAGPSSYGTTQAGEGSVIGGSIPRSYFDKWREGRHAANRVAFQAELASVVRSAVQFVFVPDIQFDQLDFSERVLVPLIVFRDHLLFDPLKPGHKYSLDVEAIRSELKRLVMPGQTVEVVAGMQSLLAHERIAIAFNKASRSDSVHESFHGRYRAKFKHFVDSQALIQELSVSSDYLASGLISASPVLSHEFFPDFESEKDFHARRKDRRWALGTRVLPVFVFSVEQNAQPLLFDNLRPYAASKDVVVVLQSDHEDVPLPFFASGQQITTSLANPLAPILAGLGAAFGGLMPPQERYDQLQGKVVTSALWAHGASPFGPFANGSAFSQLAIEQVVSNNFVSRLNAAIQRVSHSLSLMDDFADTYLFDSLGEGVEAHKRLSWLQRLRKDNLQKVGAEMAMSTETVAGLHRMVVELEDELAKGAEAMLRQRREESHRASDAIFAKASALHKATKRSLSKANQLLDCCSVQHQVEGRAPWNLYARAGLTALAAGCLVALAAFLNPALLRRAGGRKQKPVIL